MDLLLMFLSVLHFQEACQHMEQHHEQEEHEGDASPRMLLRPSTPKKMKMPARARATNLA
jgi:hypothetical protein